MAKNTQKTDQKPIIEDDFIDVDPVYIFEPFNYAPKHLTAAVMAELPSYDVCRLVNNTIDIARGAALVFQITEEHQCELLQRSPKPYLSDYHLGQLRRLAFWSLEGLADSAGEIADLLQKIESSKQSNGGEV